MAHGLVVTPLVGQAESDRWSNVVVNAARTTIWVMTLRGARAAAWGSAASSELVEQQPHSALEFHQIVTQFLTQAKQAELQVECAAALFMEERCVLAAQSGMIWLRRHHKTGKIVVGSAELKVVEGSFQPHDVFAFATQGGGALEKFLVDFLNTDGLSDTFQAEFMPQLAGLSDQSSVAIAHVTFGPPPPPPARHSSDDGSLPPDLEPIPVMPAKNLKYYLSYAKGVIRRGRQIIMRGSDHLQRAVGNLFSSDVYVRKQSSRKLIGIVLPIILVVMAINMGVFAYVSQRREQQRAAEAIVAPLRAQLQEIQGAVERSPVEARKQTEDVIIQLEQAIKDNQQRGVVKGVLETELAKMREYYASISGLEELPLLATFFDLRLVQSDFLANRMDLAGNVLVFLDTGQRKIISVDIEKKQSTNLPIGEYPDLKDVVGDEKNLYLLGSGGLYRFTMGSVQNAVQLKGQDESSQNAQFIRSFGEYVYVLNEEKRNVFRYVPKDGTTYSDPIGWIQPGMGFDMSEVQSFAIDGSVWFGMKSGEIRRFSSGKPDEFTITGLKDALTTPVTLFTKENLQNVYVIEPQKNRLVVFSKKGEFLKEVKSSSFASTTAVVASEQNHKAYVLSGSLVYEVEL